MTLPETAERPLTELAVRELVLNWYRLLDRHAPVEELLGHLAGDELVMRFPEAEVRGQDGFTGWYEGVIRRFFDEVHDVTTLKVDLGDRTRATLTIVVNWQARIWDPPAARSAFLGFDAFQTWVVEQGPTGRPVVTSYTVDELRPMEGSASL